jgi:hypothetical protein
MELVMPIGFVFDEQLLPFLIAPALAGDVTGDEDVASVYAIPLWDEE